MSLDSAPSVPPIGGYLLSLEETAARLGLSKRRLRQLADAGQVPCIKLPDGRGVVLRFRIDLVERALHELGNAGDAS